MAQGTIEQGTLSQAPEPDAAALSDREMLEEIHSFMRDIKGMVSETAPVLEKLGKSSMGKMLGLR